MNKDIRESISHLGQLRTVDLAATDNELTVLLSALRKEVETQTSVVNTADSSDPAYIAASNDLVGLLQLSQAVVDAKAELGKLAGAVTKAVGRVLKKAPK